MKLKDRCLVIFGFLCLLHFPAIACKVILAGDKELSEKSVGQQKFKLRSPDGYLVAMIDLNDSVTYRLLYRGKQILNTGSLSMILEHSKLGIQGRLLKAATRNNRSSIVPLLGDFAKLPDDFKELKLDFSGDYSIVFRMYNEGLAYRFVTRSKDSIKVIRENASFRLAQPASATLAQTENFTAWELPYERFKDISEIPQDKHALTPALFSFTAPRTRVIIAESDVEDYPGMYLQRTGSSFHGLWAGYPDKTEMGSWGNFVSVVKTRFPFIARTTGTRNFPWRVVIITDDDKTLLVNKLIYKLAAPSRVGNANWIKPGKAAWEWWHDALLPGADIASGMDNRTTALYDYYVDFAARAGLQYMMVDAGWSNVYNVQKPNPKIAMQDIIQRARGKNVGVFLWCVASTLMNDLEGNLDYLKALGAAGLKVDFFDRDDQVAMAWMTKIAAEAAKRHLLIDFHGCTKPSGLERAYPNIVNYEAVRGAECDKWDTTANPRHHLTFPFIRMLGGPLDYTPGSMRNKSRSDFKPIGEGMPSSMGTRCHELAMYVIFDQPLAMLCDAPTEYEKYPDILHYLSLVPTTYDDTKVLAAEVGEMAVMAKRKGVDWYVGAMTNWTPREIHLDFSFLDNGTTYKAEIFQDVQGGDAADYAHKIISVTNKTSLDLHLEPGGGAVLYIRR